MFVNADHCTSCSGVMASSDLSWARRCCANATGSCRLAPVPAESARALMDRVLTNLGNGSVEAAVRGEVQELTGRFPLYAERLR